MNKFKKISLEKFLKDTQSTEEEYENITLPKRATKSSAGYDFFAPSNISLAPGGYAVIHTGIKCQLDEDKVLMIYPRSGLGFKYKIHLYNTVGVIDSDYYNNENNEGHIKIKICNGSSQILKIKTGEAFAQGIITQFFTAEEEEVTTERKGGFGSTYTQNLDKSEEMPIGLVVENSLNE